MIVRQCRQRDLAVLEQQLPTGGIPTMKPRYGRQREGVSTFLVAYLSDVPVGCGEILWQGAKEPEVRDRFPDCPEINGLAVVPERQSQGIGTKIIRVAEQLATLRGHHQIGLGVGEDNPRAAALYLRLGYRDARCRYLDRYQDIDEHGVRHEVADPCRFLVKAISGTPDRRPSG